MADPTLRSTEITERLQAALGDEYRLGSLIGEGGFAEVYAAADVRLKREVAIKTLRSDVVVTETILARFEQEAEAIAALRHPNVIEVYSVGRGEGTAYFVMPKIVGTTLEDLLEEAGALEIGEAERILRACAGALGAAHEAGMVHRDVKPANVLLEGPGRRVLLTDFGIAKVLEHEGVATTGGRTFLGTPIYVSPEQASGDELDHRSDLYSLGAMAFHMIAGRPPFEGETTRQLVVKHLTEAPPSLRSFRPECPDRLAEVVERCLAKEPADRWEDAFALLRALETVSHQASDAFPRVVGEAPAWPMPVRHFRKALLVGAPAALLAPVVEAVTLGTVIFSPVVWAVAGLVVAYRYGRMWNAGYGLRQVLLPRSETERLSGRPGGGVGRAERAGFGEHAGLVRECRADRARAVLALGQLPFKERERMPDALGKVDRLMARILREARQLATLEGRLSFEEDSRGLGAAGDTHERLINSTITELREARSKRALQLQESVETLGELRLALERAADGSAEDPYEKALAALDRAASVGAEVIDESV